MVFIKNLLALAALAVSPSAATTLWLYPRPGCDGPGTQIIDEAPPGNCKALGGSEPRFVETVEVDDGCSVQAFEAPFCFDTGFPAPPGECTKAPAMSYSVSCDA